VKIEKGKRIYKQSKWRKKQGNGSKGNVKTTKPCGKDFPHRV